MVLKFTLRNLQRRPFLNLIKVTGLGLAFSGFLLIVLFLKNELTYESFNRNAARTYRLTVHQAAAGAKHFARIYNPVFIPQMTSAFPEIEDFVRLVPVRGGIIKHNDEPVLINQAFECDSTFFKIFPSEFLAGNPKHVLDAPGSMVISEGLSTRIFGKSDPVGKALEIPAGQFYGNSMEYIITGVMKDFPRNSHFHPEFIAAPVQKDAFNGWAYTYLILAPGADPELITSGFRSFIASEYKIKPEEIETDAELQKITDIHLHSGKLREIESNSNINVIYTLGIAALILLLTGLSNYSNLNMGMAGYSDKYLFIGKVTGSSALNDVNYFLTEGIIVVSSSIILGLVLSIAANTIIIKYASLDLFEGNGLMISAVILVSVLAGILSGILPVFRQVAGQTSSGRKNTGRSIMVLQFVLCTALIISVIAITRQTRYALESGMGYKYNNLICISDVHSDAQKRFGVFKEELLKHNTVVSVSAMMDPPGGEANDAFGFELEDYVADAETGTNLIGVLPCDHSFVSIFGLTLLSGSDFSPGNSDNEGSGEYLINESALKSLNYANPEDIVGKAFRLVTNIPSVELPKGKIIGVVKDFHLSGIRKKVAPLVLFKRSDMWLGNFVIAFRPGMQEQAIPDIRAAWEKLFPGFPFQFEYIDSMYNSVYQSEVLQSSLLSVFTAVSLFICAMGLLGMTLLATQKRTKEIGLRKINGATSAEVMLMFSLDLVKWTILSFFIALPFAWFAMNKWLENFAYQVSLSWWIFVVAGLTLIFITLVTISYQSWKASARNPVEALRYE